MLHDRSIKNISELKTDFVDRHKNPIFFRNIVENLKIWKHHAIFSGVKIKGVSVLSIISILISFPFIDNTSIFSFTKSKWQCYVNYGKDIYYRFINKCNINWRLFLLTISKHSLAERGADKNKSQLHKFRKWKYLFKILLMRLLQLKSKTFFKF